MNFWARLILYNEQLLAARSTNKAEDHPDRLPRLVIQYIGGYAPSLEAVSFIRNLWRCHAVGPPVPYKIYSTASLIRSEWVGRGPPSSALIRISEAKDGPEGQETQNTNK